MSTILIKGGVVLTLNPKEEIFPEGYVLIESDKIKAVGPADKLPPEYNKEEIIDASECLIMPGLINTHTHAAMSLLRGIADDLPLSLWLSKYIFPTESQQVNPEFVYWGTLLAGLEMIHSGTTCFIDGYFFEEEACQAAYDLGIRGLLGQGIFDLPTPDVPDPKSNLNRAEKYLNQTLFSSLVIPTLFCHSAYACKPETLKKVRQICNYYSVPLLIHLAETDSEIKEITDQYGVAAVNHLVNSGIFEGETIAAHCVWVKPEEFLLLKASKVKIAHCPESNMKLASGVAPIPDFLNLSIPVGLGTDGCASNNNLDMFGEMDTCAKIHKLIRQDPSVMDAKTVVKMATIGGAEVFGFKDKLGSLEAGKKADLIILNWSQPHLTPVYNYYSHLVYSACGHDVQTVIIDGKIVMHNQKILTVDEKEVLATAKKIGEKIKSSSPHLSGGGKIRRSSSCS